jgi:hypothetical protein
MAEHGSGFADLGQCDATLTLMTPLDTNRLKIVKRAAIPVHFGVTVVGAERPLQGRIDVHCSCEFNARLGLGAEPVCESAKKCSAHFFRFGSYGFDYTHRRD